MSSARTNRSALLLLGAVALAGCSGDDVPEAAVPSASTAAAAPAAGSAPPAEQPDAPAAAASRATVTVDGETWEFSPFRCAVGNEQTGSEEFSFSSDARGAGEGEVELQFQINARDASGQNRLTGDGVVYDFTLYDYGSASPTIDYAGDATGGVTIGAGTLVVDGEFTSFTGETYAVTVDAVCGA